MLVPGINRWYTDTVDIYRRVEIKEGPFTETRNTLIKPGVRCRVFRASSKNIQPSNTNATTNPSDKLAVTVDTDIRTGDILFVHRGAALRRMGTKLQGNIVKYIAGEPYKLYEPVGGARGRIAHIEIAISGKKEVSSIEEELLVM